MKKRRLNQLLALVLTATMVVGQPVQAIASEGAVIAVEEEPAAEESSTEQPVIEESSTEEPVTEEESSTEQPVTKESSTEESATEEESSTEKPATEESSTEESAAEEDSTEQQTTEENSTDVMTEESATEETTEEDQNSSALAVTEDIQIKLHELGFETMSLSDEMIQEKMELSHVADSLRTMEAGEDYLENEVIYFAESQEEAEQIAKCYGGTLSEYEYGVAVAVINATVSDAVSFAADANVAMPAVYPNIVYQICDEWEMTGTQMEDSELSDMESQDSGLIDEADVEHEELMDESKNELELPCDDEMLYATASNDPYFSKQWYHTTMNTVEAWNASKGDGVVVAVIDTGVDYEHPDLKSNIVGYTSTLGSGDGRDDNGRDDNGHGTHCAGLIAAVADNNIGVAGMAPNAKIYSAKVLNASGKGSTADIVQGVRAATEQNVDVISMSLGGICWDRLFQQAIDRAVAKGIVVVAAAGNESTDQKSYPAAYNNVISVAATGKDNALTNFSNYGTWVDIAAPGYNMLSTLPTNFTDSDLTYESTGYGYASGTSMACPVVAGTVALMLGNSSKLKDTNTKSGVNTITKTLIKSAQPDGAQEYFGFRTYPLADAEATVYAVDANDAVMPTISFSTEPGKNNVVLAGEKQYFELKTTTPHSKIYFTLNGKKPTAENGYLYTGRIYMPYSGKVKIQAVTVVGSKTSKVFSKTYTFDVKAEKLTPADDGKFTVAIGKSIQLTANIEPYNTSKRNLKWTCMDETGKIKVNQSGKVTCNAKATENLTAKITAETMDGSGLKCEFTVTAVKDKVTKLILNKDSLNMSYYANVSGLTMKDKDGNAYVSSFKLIPTCEGTSTNQFLYKSSNTKVATVDPDGTIHALEKGKANITVTANDGSGKKAVCKVTVVTPVFNIYTYSSTGFSGNSSYIPIGVGCSIKMNTYVNYARTDGIYNPSNKKIDWSSSNDNAITVRNGTVKCANKANIGDTVKITATANDKFGASTTVTFRVVDKIEKFTYKNKTSYSCKLEVGQSIYDLLRSLEVRTKKGTDSYYGSVIVKNSNRDVVYRGLSIFGYTLIGTKPGTSKVTYIARDGSNTKFTINFKVTEPKKK